METITTLEEALKRIAELDFCMGFYIIKEICFTELSSCNIIRDRFKINV